MDLSFVANIFGIIGGIAIFINLAITYTNKKDNEHQEEFLNKAVTIKLDYKGNTKGEKILPLHMKRRDVSRAEILGRVGMFKKERYELPFELNPNILEDIEKLQLDKTVRELIIFCRDEEEFNSFKIP